MRSLEQSPVRRWSGYARFTPPSGRSPWHRRKWRTKCGRLVAVLLGCAVVVGCGLGFSDDQGPGGVPLLNAIEGQQSAEQVRQLLASGVDPNKERTENDLTPLFAAARRGDIEIIALLFQYGANPLTRDVGGWTPLMAAAISESSSVKLVQLLLDNGADPCPSVRPYGVDETARSLAEAHHSPAVTLLTEASRRC